MINYLRIITTSAVWVFGTTEKGGKSWNRKYIAWVSELNNIKWNKIHIVNPAKYQG